MDGQRKGLEYRWVVSFVTQASASAKRATATISNVIVGVADPIGTGLIASLARPGGNVTGTSSIATQIVGKQSVFQAQQVKQAEEAARRLGIELHLFEATAANEFDAAFIAINREGYRALVILIDPLYMSHVRSFVELSVKGRFIATMGFSPFADAGGSYPTRPGAVKNGAGDRAHVRQQRMRQ